MGGGGGPETPRHTENMQRAPQHGLGIEPEANPNEGQASRGPLDVRMRALNVVFISPVKWSKVLLWTEQGPLQRSAVLCTTGRYIPLYSTWYLSPFNTFSTKLNGASQLRRVDSSECLVGSLDWVSSFLLADLCDLFDFWMISEDYRIIHFRVFIFLFRFSR